MRSTSELIFLTTYLLLFVMSWSINKMVEAPCSIIYLFVFVQEEVAAGPRPDKPGTENPSNFLTDTTDRQSQATH